MPLPIPIYTFKGFCSLNQTCLNDISFVALKVKI